MKRLVTKTIFLVLLASFTGTSYAQVTIRGVVYDVSRKNYVEQVKVISTAGAETVTDSMGRYQIAVSWKDSLSFVYNNKPTMKFPVKDIADINQFDISLQVHVKSKYNTLKEVVVIAKSYREDSMENRRIYGDYFDFQKPGLRTGVSPDGVVGADINEIINLFRFGRNKRLKAFRARLEQQEQEKFINYRFSKPFVKRITQLNGADLDTFLVRYRPTYEFASTADEVTFNKYVLNASYRFKLELLQKEAARKPEDVKN